MADHTRVASWSIGLSGDDQDITQFLSALKSKFQSTVNDLERTSSQANLFSGLQDSVKNASDALTKAKQDVVTFTAALAAAKDAGKDVSTELQAKLTAAQAVVRSTTTEFNKQVDAISRVQSQLARAGVDTGNLAAAQIKLAAATDAATEALAVQGAKQLLGLKTLADTVPQINALNAAFATFKASGASVAEVAQAEALLQKQVAAVRAEVTKLSTGFTATAKEGLSLASGLKANFLGVALAVGGVVTAVAEVTAKAKEFNQGLGEIGVSTNLTKADLAGLGEGARTIARQFGIEIPAAFADLKQSTGAGLGPEDALAKLAIDAEAAKANLADVNTVSKLGIDIMSSYAVPVSGLRAEYDKLTAAAHNGGPAIKDLDDSFGKLLTTAKGSNIPFDVVVASLESINNAVHDPAASIQLLQQIFLKFDTQSVQDKLAQANVAANDFKGTIDALRSGNLAIPEFTELGLASAKSAAGIEGLVNGARPLPQALLDVANASGAVAASFETAEKSLPVDQIDKLKAATADLLVSLGNTGPISTFVQGLTQLANLAADSTAKQRELQDASGKSVTIFGDLWESLKAVDAQLTKEIDSYIGAADATDRLTAATKAASAAGAQAQKDYQDQTTLIAAQAKVLDGVAQRLIADSQALAAGAVEQIATATRAADEQIAALDRSAAAQTATAAKTIEIQTGLAKQRLEIIQTSEAAIAKVTDAAIAAETDARRKGGELTKSQEAQLQADLAKIKRDSLKTTIDELQKSYDSLIGLSQGYAAREQTIGQSRLTFNQGIEKQLFDIRIGTLSSFDQYVAKSQEADRLVSLSRDAAARGDSANAERYANAAIGIANTLGVTYSTNGSTIVTATQAQADKMKILKGASDSVNDSFNKEGEAITKGQILTEFYARQAKERLDEVLSRQKEINDKAAAGVNIKANADLDSFKSVRDQLDALVAARTVTIKVAYDLNSEGGPGFVGPPSPTFVGPPSSLFARGGDVLRAIQAFAAGGPIFRPPTWSKVPGSGNGDTVPAALPVGAFVMRKMASQYYGDGIMGQLVRGFASGGWVPPGGPASPWAGAGGSDGSGNASTSAEKNRALHDLKVQADTEVYAMLGRAAGLPRADVGQDVRDYIARVREIIIADNDIADATSYLDKLVTFYARFYPAIEVGKQMHQPVVMGVNVKEDSDPKTKAKPQGGTLYDNQIAGVPPGLTPLFSKGNPFGAWGGFAAGGMVDSVPAMLTPGEHVLNPPAVQLAQRMFGGGFLDALNGLRIPKGFLDGIMNVAPPQPRRFANGGYVDGPGAPMATVSGTAKGGASLTVNVYPQSMSESELNRTVLPWFNKTVRNSR